jgi:prepilin peptidase CpaA
VLALVLLIAVVTNLRKQKIYNWLTLPAIVVGAAVNGIVSGWHGLLFSVEGIAVGSAWLLLFILRGATGAGDVKLLMAVGAFMGPLFTGWTLLYCALAGGVLAVFYALRRGVLGHTVKNALLGAHVLATVQSPDSLKSMADLSKAGKMPQAPAIAMGVIIEWLVVHHII